MPELTWNSLDWPALDRLRDTFLASTPPEESYWIAPSDLANYDFTFGRRIGWKWTAVLGELRALGWTPPADIVLDWGCGSGIAGRCVTEAFGVDHVRTLRVFDRSQLAMDFAVERARTQFPGLAVEAVEPASLAGLEPVGVLAVSHVLNELAPDDELALATLMVRADAVLWVEPGTHAVSRRLIAWREKLRPQFMVVAPCTHQSACGLLVEGKERHWCHHFAEPPFGLMGDSHWVRFAQRAGIDLRSLPYSYLALERRGRREPVPGLPPEGCSRILGKPRFYKGYAKLDSCQADGVRDLMLQKRDAPELFKALKRGEASMLQRWERAGDRITRVITEGAGSSD